MRNIVFHLIIVFTSQLCNAQWSEIPIDSIRRDHQKKVNDKTFYLRDNTGYKDFTLASPLLKYGVVYNSGLRNKVVAIPFIFSEIYYHRNIPYGKIDSLWYKVDKENRKVYVLSSNKQHFINEQYSNIEWGTATNNPGEDSNASSYYGTGKGLDGYGNYQLGGRKALGKPKRVQECNEAGIVVVSIEVDRTGKVIKAVPGVRGTTNNTKCLLDPAKAAALATKFNADSKAPSKQIGKIVYRFSLSD